MKKITTFLLLFAVNLSFGQIKYIADGYTLTQGDEPKEKTKEKFIGKKGEFVFTAGFVDKNVFLAKFDANSLKTVWQVKLDFAIVTNKTTLFYKKTILEGEDLHLIYGGFSKNKKEFIIVDRVYDNNGAYRHYIELSQTPAYSFEDVNWNIFRTPDKKHYALRQFIGLVGKRKLTAKVVWFNNDFSKVDEFLIKTKHTGTLVTVKSEIATNEMNYAFAFLEGSLSATDIFLYNYIAGKGVIKKTINIDGDDFMSVNLAFNTVNNEYTVSGHYGIIKKFEFIIQGFFHYIYDASDFKLVKENTIAFDETLKIDFTNETREARRKVIEKEMNIRMKKSFFTKDGGCYLVYEYSMGNAGTRTTGSDRNTSGENILVFYFDNKNEYNFHKVILRYMGVDKTSQSPRVAVKGLVEDNNLYLYYNIIGESARRRYPKLKELKGLSANYNVLFEAKITPQEEMEIITLLTFKTKLEKFGVSISEFNVNNGPDELFFTFITDFYGKERQIASLKKSN